jgi:hypothetical protein
MAEEWRECDDFPAYEVSDHGRVRNKSTGLVLKPWKHHGYWVFSPQKDGKKFTKEIHILVAKAFLPNIENKPKVDHKDGNSLNNNLSNLRWATSTEQAQNRKQSNSKSGKSGVYISAKITFNGYSINLGLFDTPEDASEMYQAVARGLFGEFHKN